MLGKGNVALHFNQRIERLFAHGNESAVAIRNGKA
jgi:hypothetical protein